MPVSKTYYTRCKRCGKRFPVIIGDCIGSHEFLMLPNPICNKCKYKEMKANLKKRFKGGAH